MASSQNSDPVTVIIQISPDNDAPTAQGDSYSTMEDTQLIVNSANGVLNNDTDIDTNPASLSAILLSGPAHASQFQLNLDGSFTYTPAANYNSSISGDDSFQYYVSDGDKNSDPVTVIIQISPDNDAPTAQGDSYSTMEDTQLIVNAANGVLNNDTDIDTNPASLSAILLSGPAHASQFQLNLDGSFTYTPAPNYNSSISGNDSFQYYVSDGDENSDPVTVIIQISTDNDAPTAQGDSYSTMEDTQLSINAANGVLNNDTDIDSSHASLSAILLSGPAHASQFQLNLDGSFTYTSAANYNSSISGNDSFQYYVSDGDKNSDPVTVIIQITPVNDAPTSVSLNNNSVAENSPNGTIIGTITGTDPDAGDSANLVFSLTNNPGNKFAIVDNNLVVNGALDYEATNSYSITIRATDSNNALLHYDQNFTINITNVNEAAVALNDNYSINEDGLLNINALLGVLSNDSNPGNQSLSTILVSGTSHGQLTLNPDGSFSYAPAANYNGSDSFTYQAYNGSENSNIATVSITINAVNDAPVAQNDSYTIQKNKLLTVPATGVPSILANDSDIDGGTLTAVLVSGPSPTNLTSFQFNSDGSFTYQSTSTARNTFTYRVFDGTSYSNTVQVALNNAAPIVANNSYTVPKNAPSFNSPTSILANDSDANGDPLTAVLITGTTKGTLTLNTATGFFTYIPNIGASGTDTFTYRAYDGFTNSTSLATVTLTIANTAPVALADSYTAVQGQQLIVSAANGVLDNDTDANGDPLTAAIVSAPKASKGTVVLNSDGSFTYTPPSSTFTGTVTFTYRANDGTTNSGNATVTITVSAPSFSSLMAPENTAMSLDNMPADDDEMDLLATALQGSESSPLSLNDDGSYSYTG